MAATPSVDRIVGIVDDDESLRVAIGSLLRSLGIQVEMFDSSEALLGFARLDDLACLIVDIRLPGMNGFDLQQQLMVARRDLPIVFISAHDDPFVRRQALTAGALAFLRKPFSESALIEAVHLGLDRAPARYRSKP